MFTSIYSKITSVFENNYCGISYRTLDNMDKEKASVLRSHSALECYRTGNCNLALMVDLPIDKIQQLVNPCAQFLYNAGLKSSDLQKFTIEKIGILISYASYMCNANGSVKVTELAQVESVTSMRQMLLSALVQKYKIDNVDVSKIAEEDLTTVLSDYHAYKYSTDYLGNLLATKFHDDVIES